ncbi:MAG: pantoate--beta-alanine ligase, partial [Planctomycetales bacterium]|nr:pantoate--beta-alanine ligase [Planctomycetales bacterium]
DGLALSSRNRYLTPDQRSSALSLWRALTEVQQMVEKNVLDIGQLNQAMLRVLQETGAERVDYAQVVDRQTLQSLERLDRPAVALIAAYVGATRLIDNMLLEPPRGTESENT